MDFHQECTRVFLSEYFRGNANICIRDTFAWERGKRERTNLLVLKKYFLDMLYCAISRVEREKNEDYKRIREKTDICFIRG